jgi:hypothetical protein
LQGTDYAKNQRGIGGSSASVGVGVGISADEPLGNSEDDIDDFIKKHLDDDDEDTSPCEVMKSKQQPSSTPLSMKATAQAQALAGAKKDS